jgi:triacylglycerol lipase
MHSNHGEAVKSQPLGDPFRLKHPIVLVHGLGARSAYGPFDYFHWLPQQLRKAGNPLYIANLTAWHSIERRSEQLKKQIDAAFPEGKVNLIGHSMGGLDSRYATSALGLGERVASVTTVGTPNRGSAIGDMALGLVPPPAMLAIDKLLKYLDSSIEGLRQITRSHVADVLSKKMPDVPGVGYFSVTSAIPVSRFMQSSLPMFWIPSKLLMNLEGDNDGFVSVESSK